MNVNWMDGRVLAHYVDNLAPVISQKAIVYPDPANAGPLKFVQTVAEEQGESLAQTSTDSSGVTFKMLAMPVILNVPKPSFNVIAQNRLPMHSPLTIHTRRWEFSMFYHPFVQEFSAALSNDGIDGLLQRPLQLLGEKQQTFVNTYAPSTSTVATVNGSYAEEVVDTDNGAYSVYNWELFFHIPLTIAVKLSTNQRFEEAQKWFHYIFDPTDTSALPAAQRFWRTKRFFETTDAEYQEETLPAVFQLLPSGGDPSVSSNMTSNQLQELSNLKSSGAAMEEAAIRPVLSRKNSHDSVSKDGCHEVPRQPHCLGRQSIPWRHDREDK